jgi:signal transduction histidine kinase
VSGTPAALAPFQLIAEGVTAVAGFGVAALSVVRDDGQMQVLAVAGSPEAWAQLEGVRTPVDELLSELKLADDWGRFKFVPHERLDLAGENWGWVPDVVPLEVEDAWHPMDLLVAPLRDAAGELRGTLSIDLPVDGRRPGPEQRRILNAFAEQAERAVLSALEHQVLTEQVRLAETAREIVRTFSGELTMERLVDACNEALVEGFGARGLWIQTFDTVGHPGSGRVWSVAGLEVDLPEKLVALAERAAHDSWRRQAVDVVRVGDGQGQLPPEERHPIDAFLTGLGVTSVLFVPLGAGQECVGNLVLTRGADDPEWSQVEEAAARDIGRDVGRAILNARTFERERQLVTELQALDTYKTQLIATLSHELKNPLTAIVAHLELLEPVSLDPLERASLDAIDRAAQRIDRLVEDLMLLAKVGDPSTPFITQPVDLVEVTRDVVDLVSVAAHQRGVSLTIAVSDESVVALGDATELDRMVANLVGNAVKYTPRGGAVVVRLSSSADEVVLECVDTGIGIAPEDQEQLFTEFFRSRNPAALAQPGTGLGLAIVARIVARHGGRMVLCSELGSGSTFRVTLPRA